MVIVKPGLEPSNFMDSVKLAIPIEVVIHFKLFKRKGGSIEEGSTILAFSGKSTLQKKP